MGHLVKKLSAKLVENLSSPGYYGAGDGLWLQIAKGGAKSWIFRFTIAGKAREMGLGGLNAVSPKRLDQQRQCLRRLFE